MLMASMGTKHDATVWFGEPLKKKQFVSDKRDEKLLF